MRVRFGGTWIADSEHVVLLFEPDIVSIQVDGTQLRLERNQTVIPHGPDRELTVVEARPRG
jgi:hypothetical protein